eukprot:1161829-Pelagomonas_calceolata.AAC.10
MEKQGLPHLVVACEQEVAIAQERAAAAEATAREVLEAGNSGGLMQQNAVLTVSARVKCSVCSEREEVKLAEAGTKARGVAIFCVWNSETINLLV